MTAKSTTDANRAEAEDDGDEMDRFKNAGTGMDLITSFSEEMPFEVLDEEEEALEVVTDGARN
jgi:hypothetical protein